MMMAMVVMLTSESIKRKTTTIIIAITATTIKQLAFSQSGNTYQVKCSKKIELKKNYLKCVCVCVVFNEFPFRIEFVLDVAGVVLLSN